MSDGGSSKMHFQDVVDDDGTEEGERMHNNEWRREEEQQQGEEEDEEQEEQEEHEEHEEHEEQEQEEQEELGRHHNDDNLAQENRFKAILTHLRNCIRQNRNGKKRDTTSPIAKGIHKLSDYIIHYGCTADSRNHSELDKENKHATESCEALENLMRYMIHETRVSRQSRAESSNTSMPTCKRALVGIILSFSWKLFKNVNAICKVQECLAETERKSLEKLAMGHMLTNVFLDSQLVYDRIAGVLVHSIAWNAALKGSHDSTVAGIDYWKTHGIEIQHAASRSQSIPLPTKDAHAHFGKDEMAAQRYRDVFEKCYWGFFIDLKSIQDKHGYSTVVWDYAYKHAMQLSSVNMLAMETARNKAKALMAFLPTTGQKFARGCGIPQQFVGDAIKLCERAGDIDVPIPQELIKEACTSVMFCQNAPNAMYADRGDVVPLNNRSFLEMAARMVWTADDIKDENGQSIRRVAINILCAALPIDPLPTARTIERDERICNAIRPAAGGQRMSVKVPTTTFTDTLSKKRKRPSDKPRAARRLCSWKAYRLLVQQSWEDWFESLHTLQNGVKVCTCHDKDLTSANRHAFLLFIRACVALGRLCSSAEYPYLMLSPVPMN